VVADRAEREVLRLALRHLHGGEALAAGHEWPRLERRQLGKGALATDLERQQHPVRWWAPHPLGGGRHAHRAAVAGEHRDVLLAARAERYRAGHDPALRVEAPQLLAGVGGA